MVTITASAVKELRERTGAGMMECKKALVATEGNMEEAVNELRKWGVTKADKKSGRVAAEGIVFIEENPNEAILIEVNSETVFVSREPHFLVFVKEIAKAALRQNIHNMSELSQLKLANAQTVEEERQALVAKVGENVQVRRMNAIYSAVCIGTYLHGNRIGVIVELDSDNKELAHDIAMHIAATKPVVVSPQDVSPDLLAKEREIYSAQAATSGKPAEIIEKMVEGRIKKYLDEISLVGQPFVKDPNLTVGDLLTKHRAKVLRFYRYEVGEGIEKIIEDFKESVLSQVKNS